jgi:hypothetical protein
MSDDLLWEIADLLDAGEIVYLHRDTDEILSHPDPKRWDGWEAREMIEEIENSIEAHRDEYFMLEPPAPHEGFLIMEAFVGTVTDERLKQQLNDALRSKKPFRYFRTAVDDSPLRQDWFDFKDAWMKVWITDKLAMLRGEATGEAEPQG